MEVLKTIKEAGFQPLIDRAIKINRNEDGRIILNYDQINSPKMDNLVQECRGLTVDQNGDLIARGFKRFFNLGEAEEITKEFDWSEFSSFEKVDGSYIKIFYWNGDWRIQTRNSFAEGVMEDGKHTWRQLVKKCLDNTNFKELEHRYRQVTLICELCSIHNKIVVEYPTPKLYLLASFVGIHELSSKTVDIFSKELNIERPQEYKFTSIKQVQNHIKELEFQECAFEGLVLRDKNGLRLKVKNPHYLRLAALKQNGNIFLVKNLVPIIMEGNLDEYASYFPELRDRADPIIKTIDKIKDEIMRLWEEHSHKDKKDFALSVKEHPYCTPLLLAKSRNQHPLDFITSDFILKLIKYGAF